MLSLFATPKIGSGMCAFRSLTLRPLSGPQPTNLLVHLNGYGADIATVRTLATRNPRLASSEHVIPLQVVQTYIGEQRVALAVLKPSEELRRNVTYLFEADGVSDQDLVAYTESGRTIVTFRADAKADRDPPVWISPPRVLGGAYRSLGCGPSSYARIAIDAKDAGPLFVKVEIEKTSEIRRLSYILPVVDGVLGIGHGMCAGAFRLAPGEKARAHLTLVDLAGNETAAPGGAVELKGPGPERSEGTSP